MKRALINRLVVRLDLYDEKSGRKRERREIEGEVENTREMWAFVMTSKMVRETETEASPKFCNVPRERVRTLGQAHCTSAST